MIYSKFQSRSFVTLKKTGSQKMFKIFEAIRSQMSSNCHCAALDWLEFFLTFRRIGLPNASEFLIGRLICRFVPYALRSFSKFAITVLLRLISLAMTR